MLCEVDLSKLVGLDVVTAGEKDVRDAPDQIGLVELDDLFVAPLNGVIDEIHRHTLGPVFVRRVVVDLFDVVRKPHLVFVAGVHTRTGDREKVLAQ